MTTPASTRPVLPAHTAHQLHVLARAEREFPPTTAALEAVLATLLHEKSADELAAEAEYERQRVAYNAAVDAHNAPIKARRAARAAAAERTAIRASVCPACHCQHAGECY